MKHLDQFHVRVEVVGRINLGLWEPFERRAESYVDCRLPLAGLKLGRKASSNRMLSVRGAETR